MRETRRLLALMLLLSIAVLMRAGTASACSCMPLDPTTAIPGAPAAFIGTFTGDRTGGANPLGDVMFAFEVEQWVKGDLGNPVFVRTASSGASCGLEVQPGQRVGVVLRMDGDIPTAGLCDVVSAEAMLAALEPLVFDGTGPPRYVVSGWGQPPILLFDAEGGLVGAIEELFPQTPVPCEGERLLAVPSAGRVAIYDLATLQPVMSHDASAFADHGLTVASCDETGASVVVTVVEWTDSPKAAVVELPDRVLASGPFMEIHPAGAGWIGLGNTDVVRIGRDGEARVIHSTGPARDPAISLRIAVSTNGALVAVSEYRPSGHSVYYVYEVVTGALVHTIGPRQVGDLGWWVSDEELLFNDYPAAANEPTWFNWNPLEQTVEPSNFEPIWSSIADGDRFVAVQGARLLSTSPDDPSDVVELATLRNDQYRLVAVLHDAEPIQSEPGDGTVAPPTGVTVAGEVPPVFIDTAHPDSTGRLPWLIGGGAAGVLFVTGAWIYRRRRLRLP